MATLTVSKEDEKRVKAWAFSAIKEQTIFPEGLSQKTERLLLTSRLLLARLQKSSAMEMLHIQPVLL